MPEVVKLVELLKEWRAQRRARASAPRSGTRCCRSTPTRSFSIGIVNATLQPVVSARRLRNVPDTGLYGFDPTCYLGVYMPDTFWLGEES